MDCLLTEGTCCASIFARHCKMGAACRVCASANFSLNDQKCLKAKNKHMTEETPRRALNKKTKNSGHGLYLGNQMKESTAEFLIMKPIVSCEYFLAVLDRNPIARVVEKSAYFCV